MDERRISVEDVVAARAAFEQREPRDLFYRAATELVALALEGRTSLSTAEAVAVLLQTWNRAFYQYRKFDRRHFLDIEGVLRRHDATLQPFRDQTIDGLQDVWEGTVTGLFGEFETVLGPVGAAKCLHLLAPRFFPLWDRSIADSYGLPLGRRGTNGTRYWQFMLIAKRQCTLLDEQGARGANALKSIDEFNYCRYTKGWI